MIELLDFAETVPGCLREQCYSKYLAQFCYVTMLAAPGRNQSPSEPQNRPYGKQGYLRNKPPVSNDCKL